MEMFNSAIGGATISGQFTTACTGQCAICPSATATCFNEGFSVGNQNFQQTAAYSGTITGNGGMSDITGTFYPNSYYVDGQGLYIDAAQSFSSGTESLALSGVAGQGGFSAIISTKGAAAPAGGNNFKLTNGGSSVVSVDMASGTSLSVTVNGVTQTFAGLSDYSDNWLTYGISVFQTSSTDSYVCISAPTGVELCQDFLGATMDATLSYEVGFGGEQTMNDIEFFSTTMSTSEMSSYIGTAGCGTATYGQACLSCLLPGAECQSTCLATEFWDGAACTACPLNCAACWGLVVDECWACTTAAAALGVAFVEADTVCNECGDSYRYTTEACDDGNIAAGDGCSATCTIESPFACALGVDMTPDTCSLGFASMFRLDWKSGASNPADSDGSSTGTTV